MSISKHKRDLVALGRKYFASARVVQGGKHLKLVCKDGDMSATIVCPATPSDRRSILNIEAQIAEFPELRFFPCDGGML